AEPGAPALHDALPIFFSGDIGPDGTALIPDPAPPPAADLVLMESTYGDRDHRSREDTLDEIGQVLDTAWEDGGNLLVPSFAVGRSEEHTSELQSRENL